VRQKALQLKMEFVFYVHLNWVHPVQSLPVILVLAQTPLVKFGTANLEDVSAIGINIM
jgi:hypothetical protein